MKDQMNADAKGPTRSKRELGKKEFLKNRVKPQPFS